MIRSVPINRLNLLSRVAIAKAWIRHRRYAPKKHDFQSTLHYLYFDPDHLAEISQGSSLWSHRRFNVLNLYENDFLTAYQGTIREKVDQAISTHYQQDANTQIKKNLVSDDQIRVLALPRTLGFRFNSVVFYYVFDATTQLKFILSEITNTPWNERKIYVHDCDVDADKMQHAKHNKSTQSAKQFSLGPQQQSPNLLADQDARFEFDKSFHVSPFMPMNLQYQWHFRVSNQKNIIHMKLFEAGDMLFDAMMRFELEPITLSSQQTRYAIYHVFEPLKMVFGIYLQAFRLWKKNIPFYRHPKKTLPDHTGKVKDHE